jgi:PIN domain nuclease of toxin-antitoxin system
MRLLLDTHALLWWFMADAQLPKRVRRAILDETNEILVSAASAWEVATKHRLGKLPEAREAFPRFEELVNADGFSFLPVSHRHGLRAGSYVVTHADPFDRMLAAQAELDGLLLVSRDPAFSRFPVQVLW